LPNCWSPIFFFLPKLDGCQVGLPNCWSCSNYPFNLTHNTTHVCQPQPQPPRTPRSLSSPLVNVAPPISRPSASPPPPPYLWPPSSLPLLHTTHTFSYILTFLAPPTLAAYHSPLLLAAPRPGREERQRGELQRRREQWREALAIGGPWRDTTEREDLATMEATRSDGGDGNIPPPHASCPLRSATPPLCLLNASCPSMATYSSRPLTLAAALLPP
jgi:hypothetical protein